MHLSSGLRRRDSWGSPGPAPGGNPQTGSGAVRRRLRCPEHQGQFRGLPRPGGSRNSCCRGLLASDSGGSGGMAGSGVMGSCCPRGPALSLGPGETSAPTGRKLLTRAWRQGPESSMVTISQGSPVLGTVPSCRAQPPAQRLHPPGAWLAAQLEVVPVPPGLCSPAGIARPIGLLEAVKGSREERQWTLGQRSYPGVHPLSVQPSRPPPGRAHPTPPLWLGRVQGAGTTGLSQLGPVTAWTEGGIRGPGGTAGPWKK